MASKALAMRKFALILVVVLVYLATVTFVGWRYAKVSGLANHQPDMSGGSFFHQSGMIILPLPALLAIWARGTST